MSAHSSLLTALHRHAAAQPDQRALVFLDADGAEMVVATFAAVAADTRRAAWAWHCQGVQPGDAVRSNHCFSGYYRRPDLTERVLHDGWYDTGDLGYLAGGELFILGRKDDLIIVGGENIQPQAIEELATDVLGTQGWRAVAFGIRDEELGTQLPVLVCETRQQETQEKIAAWQAAIAQQVQKQLNVALADIRFVPKGWVEQSDAKIARATNREKYLAEAHRTTAPAMRLSPAPPADPVQLEQALLALVAQMLGVPSVRLEVYPSLSWGNLARWLDNLQRQSDERRRSEAA